MKQFEMTDMGFLHFYLGLQIYQQYNRILISQSKYVLEILKKFGMIECKSVSTPIFFSKFEVHKNYKLVDEINYR